MEDYLYLSAQGPSSISPLPVALPSYQNIGVPLQPEDTLSCLRDFQEFNLPTLYPDNSHGRSVMRIESYPGLGLEPLESLRALDLSTAISTKISPPVTPTGSDMESLGECNPSSTNVTNPKCASTKRRLQNRQAQRRFRQRKEERQQTLEQETARLETKYQELLQEFNRKSDEASKTCREKEILLREIENLRKRWHLMVLLLSRPNGLQSLTTLLGNSPNQLLSGTSTTGAVPVDLLPQAA